MNTALLRHTFRQHRGRLLVVMAALTVWGTLMPVIYATFGITLRDLVQDFPVLEQFMQFGGGDMFTLPGSIGLGYIHPISIALLSVFAIVYPLGVVAGERQRGTLEVVLARPVSRRGYFVTLFVASIVFVGLAIAATLVGTAISTIALNLSDELLANLSWLWLHGTALYVAIAAISFAASVTFDRQGPAASLTLAIVMTSYFFQVLGSLWPDAEWLQPFFLFYYLKPADILTGGLQLFDLAVLAVVTALAVVYALVIFPRRDLGAPA